MLDPYLDVPKSDESDEESEECKICLSKTIVEENLALVLETLYVFNKKTADILINNESDYHTSKQIIEDIFYSTQIIGGVVLDSTKAIEALKNCDCAGEDENEIED